MTNPRTIDIGDALADTDTATSLMSHPGLPSYLPDPRHGPERPDIEPYDATKLGLWPVHSAEAREAYGQLLRVARDATIAAVTEAHAQWLEEAAFETAVTSWSRGASRIGQAHPLIQAAAMELLKARAIRTGRTTAAIMESFRQRALSRRI